MQQIVTPNDFSLRIGEKRVSKSHLSAMPLIRLYRIDADGDNANTSRIEVRKPLLETPQLGVTEWSPETAVKNQYRASWFPRRRQNQVG
jgi:hypothetical protein